MKALAEVAPKFLTPERIIKMALIASNRQPKLLDCTGNSILEAVIASVELGLDCSGGLGRAYLVPYGNKATFIVGYLGLMELAWRSDAIKSIQAEVVYKQDRFKYEKGLVNELTHVEDEDGEQLDEDIIGAYTICQFKSGGYHIHYMRRKQIEKIRQQFAKTDTFWKKHYAAMCKKTVVRAASKFWPLSVESQVAISQLDDGAYSDAVAPAVTLTPTDGREKWGFDQQQQPLPTGSAPDNAGHSETGEPTDAGKPSVSDDDRKMLVSDIAAKLARKGLKAKTDIDSAVQDMCKGLGTNGVEGIVSVDQYNAALQWIEEGL